MLNIVIHWGSRWMDMLQHMNYCQGNMYYLMFEGKVNNLNIMFVLLYIACMDLYNNLRQLGLY